MDKQTADSHTEQKVYVIGEGSDDKEQMLISEGILGKSFTNDNAYVVIGYEKYAREALYNLEDIFLTEIEQHKEMMTRLAIKTADMAVKLDYLKYLYDKIKREYKDLKKEQV